MKKHSPAEVGLVIAQIIKSTDGSITLNNVQTNPALLLPVEN